jgi:hypothetical protein
MRFLFKLRQYEHFHMPLSIGFAGDACALFLCQMPGWGVTNRLCAMGLTPGVESNDRPGRRRSHTLIVRRFTPGKWGAVWRKKSSLNPF